MIKRWIERLRSLGGGSGQHPPKTLDALVRNEFGLKIKNRAYYDEAMTHASMLDGDTTGLKSNERLEFLGDNALDLTVATFLFSTFPKDQEGALTQRKSQIVNRKTLNLLGERMGLPHFIRAKMRRKDIQDSVVGNALEALIGAIYLDHGFQQTSQGILRMIKRHGADDKVHQTADFKSKLLHWTQRNRKSLDFRVVKEYVEDGDTRYDMEVRVDGAVFGVGSGRSKKLAEQHAAHHAWRTVYDRYIAQRGEESSVLGEAAEKAIRAMPAGTDDGPRMRRRGPRGSGSRAKKEALSSAKPVGRGIPKEQDKPASSGRSGGPVRDGRRPEPRPQPQLQPEVQAKPLTPAAVPGSGAVVRKDRVDRAARAARLAEERAAPPAPKREESNAKGSAPSGPSEGEAAATPARKPRRRPKGDAVDGAASSE